MIQYSKNKSTNTGNFTGKILITAVNQGKTNTLAVDFNENQIVGLSDLSLLKRNNDMQSSINKFFIPLKNVEPCGTVFYFECPPGSVWNASINLCDWPSGIGTECSGYFMDECGNYYGSCSQSNNSQCVGVNIDCFSGNILCGEVRISLQTLVLISASGFSAAYFLSQVPHPVALAIAGVLTITSIWTSAGAAVYPNGIKISYMITPYHPQVYTLSLAAQ